MFRTLLLLATLALGTAIHAQTPSSGALDPSTLATGEMYAEGVRLQDQDRWEEALEFWEEAWEEMAAREVRDPRVGAAYLELAIARQDSSRYGAAAEFFLWSMAPPLVEGSRMAVEMELERLLLIADEPLTARLQQAREEGDRALMREIRRFWIESDPTPTTNRNERLEEHWGRIHHAREEFVYTRRPPLGTDDRGKIFLKFGEPDRVRSGHLGASEMELRIRIPQDPEARERLRRYDTNPQYEVWVYESLNPRGLTYFLFGNVDGTGPFQLVDGVHELLPRAARSRSSARYTPGGVPASYFLELFYYQDLSKVGGHFGDRFAEMDQLWNRYTYARRTYGSAGRWAPQESEIESLTFRYRQEDAFFPPTPPEVPSISAFQGKARDELVAQVIRTLSDDDIPVLVVVGSSAPRILDVMPDLYTAEMNVPEWVMQHTLIIRDSDLAEVGRLVQPISLTQADLSTFVIRHVPEPLHLTLTARTLYVPDDERTDTLVSGDRLPGQVHFTPGEPLSTDPEAFEMSDILTGTLVPPEIDGAALPYPLLPARQIWRRDPLRVYLELYHMAADGDGRALLDATFRVVPLTDNGEDDPTRSPVTLAVQLTPRTGRPYRESFDMQLRDQRPGRYRLEVEVTDRLRGQTRFRTVELELVD